LQLAAELCQEQELLANLPRASPDKPLANFKRGSHVKTPGIHRYFFLYFLSLQRSFLHFLLSRFYLSFHRKYHHNNPPSRWPIYILWHLLAMKPTPLNSSLPPLYKTPNFFQDYRDFKNPIFHLISRFPAIMGVICESKFIIFFSIDFSSKPPNNFPIGAFHRQPPHRNLSPRCRKCDRRPSHIFSYFWWVPSFTSSLN